MNLQFEARAWRDQQRNRLREVSQPVAQCVDSRLRWCWQRDRNARAHRRVQRMASLHQINLCAMRWTSVMAINCRSLRLYSVRRRW